MSPATNKGTNRTLAVEAFRQARLEATLHNMRKGVADEDESWIPGPLWWAWNCTETFDNHWLAKGLPGPHRPFPRLPYFPWFFYKLLAEKILFVPKSREMLVSWAAMV